jgi:cardiolipin synthase
MLTGATLLPGNRVEVALNGDGTYERLWDDLRLARESITLQVYYRQRSGIATTLRQILIERAVAGVRVYVLYDAFGSSSVSRRDRDALQRAGSH